jgi:predicted amidophosphoribosyltransferase
MGEWSLPNPSDEPAENTVPRFTWPPRRAPVEVVGQQPTTAPRPTGVESRSDAPGASPASHRPASLPLPRRPGSPLARAWSEIEHTWLDVVASPLAERMAEEYWIPDAPTDYCPRCALSVGKHEAIEGLCAACQNGQTTRPPWQRIIRLGEYEAPLSRWICEVKFTRWRVLGRDLGRVLGDSIQAQIELARAAGTIPDSPPVIVPVPMSLLRRFTRGIDHTLAVARGVAGRTGGQVLQPLTRDHRPSQTQVAPSSRMANVAGTFRPRIKRLRPRLGERLVIVLDDVTTTTSTLRGACRAVGECLREERGGQKPPAGGKPGVIWGAVLARTPPDQHDGVVEEYA